MARAHERLACLGALVALLGASCGSDAATTAGTAPPGTAGAEATTTSTVAEPTAPYYVSIGDSYAAGYEAGVGTTENGFAYQVVDGAATESYPLELVNFGCGGATTTSVLESLGCPSDGLGPGATPYDGRTQIEAAEEFLQEHPGEVDLITVSIGGNDVTACGAAAEPVPCVIREVEGISTNVPRLLQRLRAAAGPDVLIVGTTYPDVILGEWVLGAPEGRALAEQSVTAFKAIINPALQKAYTDAGGEFVDVTEASGGYGPLTDMTELVPYGDIPVPVARVCELTTYCEQRDIHPNAAGYRLIADLVVDAYVAARSGQPSS